MQGFIMVTIFRVLLAPTLLCSTLMSATILSATLLSAMIVEEPAKSPAEKYQALVDEFEEVGGARQFAEQFFELAEEHPQDPVAVDSLLWIVKNLKTRPEAKRALEILAQRHLDSEQLGPGLGQFAATPTVAAEQLLRACIEKSPHRSVQAEASFNLAQLLEQQAEIVDQLKQQPELAQRIMEYYGEEYGAHLTSLDSDKLKTQIEQTYEQMKASFAEVKHADSTLGAFAERALFRLQHLSVGTVAPEIEGTDIDGTQFKLSDYRGDVVLLSFWGHW
jgi:hypothetical protein